MAPGRRLPARCSTRFRPTGPTSSATCGCATRTSYVDAAVLLTQVNAQPYSKADWHWRINVAHSFGHAAAAETVLGTLRHARRGGHRGRAGPARRPRGPGRGGPDVGPARVGPPRVPPAPLALVGDELGGSRPARSKSPSVQIPLGPFGKSPEVDYARRAEGVGGAAMRPAARAAPRSSSPRIGSQQGSQAGFRILAKHALVARDGDQPGSSGRVGPRGRDEHQLRIPGRTVVVDAELPGLDSCAAAGRPLPRSRTRSPHPPGPPTAPPPSRTRSSPARPRPGPRRPTRRPHRGRPRRRAGR